jgi:hypothetical protein
VFSGFGVTKHVVPIRLNFDGVYCFSTFNRLHTFEAPIKSVYNVFHTLFIAILKRKLKMISKNIETLAQSLTMGTAVVSQTDAILRGERYIHLPHVVVSSGEPTGVPDPFSAVIGAALCNAMASVTISEERVCEASGKTVTVLSASIPVSAVENTALYSL